MIPKVIIFQLSSGIGEDVILSIPVGKVIEIHEINVHNLDIITQTYIAKIRRIAVPTPIIPLRAQVSVGSLLNSTLTSPNKKHIAMAGDEVRVAKGIATDTFRQTVSLHYTEWDIGEIPGIELKSFLGTISSGSFVTVVSTSVSIPRIVIRDYLAHAIDTTPVITARLHTPTLDNEIERFTLVAGVPNANTTQRWVLEQEGATVMNFQHRRVSTFPAADFLLSYIEHSDP